jgi:hypothetical protein
MTLPDLYVHGRRQLESQLDTLRMKTFEQVNTVHGRVRERDDYASTDVRVIPANLVASGL